MTFPPAITASCPSLPVGYLAGLPRITGIAWSYVAHTDSHFDAQLLMRFVTAYQRVETLTIGELWALASMLRVVLIENLRRCADRIVSGRSEREEADALADRLLGSAEPPPEPAERVLGVYDRKPLPRTLAVQLVQRLRDCDPHVTPALQRVEELLRAEGMPRMWWSGKNCSASPPRMSRCATLSRAWCSFRHLTGPTSSNS